ncbi:hypothetical protein ABZ192_33415 [Streptomyces sp. NPDC006235]|uniref:hypothetical protein n=1 Tax=Streptomyces sp. NPDC006235 TaxID=3156736 RepID=UPI0033B8DB88
MTDLIRLLTAWASLLLKGGRGADMPSEPPSSVLPTDVPRASWPPLPCSPYALGDNPLDATAVRSVRPYVTAHEQRRREPATTTTLGQDTTAGPYWIHGLEAA